MVSASRGDPAGGSDPPAGLLAGSTERDLLDPDEFRAIAAAIEREVGSAIVGQREAVRGALICVVAGGHALLEGVPGLGKTTLARAFAAALDLDYRRVQFTPDLMPADITGTTVLMQDSEHPARLRFERGPLFTNLVLADEINRAAPRTQSALLEAMQERTVTVANTTHRLPAPFIVLATQNPVEMYGTYPLPEAELDRFLLKLHFAFPDAEELNAVVTRTADRAEPLIEPVADGPKVERMQALVAAVPAAEHVVDYATRLVLALQPGTTDATELARQYLRLGPSPRGAQALSLAGRAVALIDGRYNLAFDDVREVAFLALRHRLILNFDAERQGITSDEIVADALERVPREPR